MTLDRAIRAIEILALLIGLGMLGYGLFGIGSTWWLVAEARGWPTVEGRVLARDWESVRFTGRNSGGYRFVPQIRYSYTVGGENHVSENVYPATAEQWQSQEELQAYLDAEFPARGPVTVSYDPAMPSRSAVILRGSYWTAATLSICGLIVLAFTWGLRASLRSS